mgnify:CR=1 FL=1|tara:strand:+ start:237404 stop:237817 length:414 start_codon:yes stop_codon:yes gene_type:complete
MLGFDTILPLVETRVHLSFGATTAIEELALHPAVQLEFRKPIGLSIDGLLHHQIATFFLWEARTQRFSGWASLAYSLQAEMGINLFKLQVGPTFDVDRRDFGYHVGLSYGRVFGVAGGGVRRSSPRRWVAKNVVIAA